MIVAFPGILVFHEGSMAEHLSLCNQGDLTHLAVKARSLVVFLVVGERHTCPECGRHVSELLNVMAMGGSRIQLAKRAPRSNSFRDLRPVRKWVKVTMSMDIVDIRINFMPANIQPVRTDRHTCSDCQTEEAQGRDSFGYPMPCVRCALVRLVRASQADMADHPHGFPMRGQRRRPHSMKQTAQL